MSDVLDYDRVHVMHDEIVKDLVTFDAEVPAVVSGDYLVSRSSPVSRMIEGLVQPALEPERVNADAGFDREVIEALLERRDLDQFAVRSTPLTHQLLRDPCTK